MSKEDIVVISGSKEDLEELLGCEVRGTTPVVFQRDYDRKPNMTDALGNFSRRAKELGCDGVYHTIREVHPVPVQAAAGKRYRYIIYIEGVGVEKV